MAAILSKANGVLRGAMLAATVTVSLGAMTVASTAPAEAAPFRHMGGPHAGHMGGFGHHWNPRWGHGPVWHHGGGWRHGWPGGWHHGWGWRHGWHGGWGWRSGYGFGVRRFAYGVGRPYFGYGVRACPIGYHRVYGLGCRVNVGYRYAYRPVRILRPYVIGRPIYHRVVRPWAYGVRPFGYGVHRFGYGVHRFGYGFGRHFGGYGHGFRQVGFVHHGFGGRGFGHAGFGGHAVYRH